MKLFSLDDHEAGVIAIGGRPIGIIAIGGFPVGVIALGLVSTGVLSFSVGVSAGVVSISCGLGVGFFGGGVGMTLALKSATVGGDISVLDREEHVEEVRKRTRFDALAEDAVEGVAFRGDVEEGWVVVTPLRWEGGYRLEVDGHVVELDDAAKKKLGAPPKGKLPRVAAHVRSVSTLDGASSATYRELPRQKQTLRCDDVEIESDDVERVTTSRLNYLGMLWKAPLWLAAIALAVASVYEAIDDLSLDRRATVKWSGQVIASNATDVPVGASCELTGELRTDGLTRQKAGVKLECGGVRVYADGSDARATIHQRAGRTGGPELSLAYANAGRKPDHSGDENDDGKPSISVDTETGRVISAHTYPKPWRIVVDVEPWSGRALHRSPARPLVETGSPDSPAR